MANYGELSRRGLIKLNNDYDKANDNALNDFLDQHDGFYEEIRPYEQIAEKLDDVTETLQQKGSQVSNAMMDRVNHVFDAMINSMTEEIDRCESVMDEQDDDESYPDDTDDEDEEEN